MDHASPDTAGTGQTTTRDAPSVAFTGGTGFKRDWKPTATTGARSFAFAAGRSFPFGSAAAPAAADAGDGRYRCPGHPSATGDGHA